MVQHMDAEGFGGCSLYGECMEACPKRISIDHITRMNHDYLRAALTEQPERAEAGAG
jgi:succinate dehydrogenase / fumarate reductase iron-sulfur subunit